MMWGPIAFLGLIALLVAIFYLFMLAVGRSAAKSDRQAVHAEQDRLNKARP